MNIGFVTIHSASDTRAYSGSAFAIRQALMTQPGVVVHDIDGLRTPCYPLWRAKQALYLLGRGQKYWINRQPAVLRSYAAQVQARAAAIGGLDVLLSPSSIPLAFYDGPLPTAFWTDATFDSVLDFYPNATGLCKETIRAGRFMEQQALDTAALAVYSSNWSQQSALRDYGADPKKVSMVPYGANLQAVPPADEIPRLIAARREAAPRILFVGVEWRRKGGDVAVEAVAELRRLGQPATLDIVGSSPAETLPDFVNNHGVLDNRKAGDCARLVDLYRSATLAFLPTRADCMPVVIAEACCFGVPMIASDVGGVSTGVRDRVTGRLLPPTASPAEWANAALELLASPAMYAAASVSARALYDDSLNWPKASSRIVAMLRDISSRSRAA